MLSEEFKKEIRNTIVRKVKSGEVTLAELNELVNDLNRLAYQAEAIQTARSEQDEC